MAPAAARALLLLIAAAAASASSCPPASPWHSLRLRKGEPPSFFQASLARRLCALQTGELEAEPLAISVPPAADWTWEALTLTAALTEAYSLSRRLHVLPGPAILQKGPDCTLESGCMFSSELVMRPGPPPAEGELWDRQRVTRHYLRGAGLLWLRQRTIDHTGCHLAAHMLAALLQPAGAFAGVVAEVTAQMQAAGRDAVCYNVAGLRGAIPPLPDGVGSGTVVLFGASESELLALRAGAGGRSVVRLAVPEGALGGAATAALSFAAAHCGTWVGALDERWAKAGLLLGLALYGRLPRVDGLGSQWKDDWGWASCSAEEWRVSVRSQGTKGWCWKGGRLELEGGECRRVEAPSGGTQGEEIELRLNRLLELPSNPDPSTLARQEARPGLLGSSPAAPAPCLGLRVDPRGVEWTQQQPQALRRRDLPAARAGYRR